MIGPGPFVGRFHLFRRNPWVLSVAGKLVELLSQGRPRVHFPVVTITYQGREEAYKGCVCVCVCVCVMEDCGMER
jgi:hypothetical protein